ncbi:imidazole glycerol phosphate synthase subunit HisH [Leptothoe kymatousa]|uniref:Imidazole glycerol phosphate synthase subunit HisH n=1 Tax=Leptothoe kymatousa TAU-MAC 1615 TaxID=2364775 RepID=A0ABS5Y6J1_9CYAN|nr:imidazole glycerol phosphate synthase subunit HisH [Leptothoe kymatousa]MBT9313479.1 imidazole glycerol phosphate synthase subunit HisH [Leptothoe kymatousa TAU-MAC 1615]
MPTIAVIDYDMGNLHSACKGLEFAGAIPIVTDQPEVLHRADGVVLPGVGSFDPAVQHLRDRNLEQPILDVIASGKPFLGICVGLQLLFEASEEGVEPGIGVLKGTLRKFKPEPSITIPHMGWNQLQLAKSDHPLWTDIATDDWVYFVHSYYAETTDPSIVAATVTHGSQTVTAAVTKDNLMAVQFHPEKSAKTGLKLLANFVEMVKQPVAVG